jgi:hypothetical protein
MCLKLIKDKENRGQVAQITSFLIAVLSVALLIITFIKFLIGLNMAGMEMLTEGSEYGPLAKF